MNLRFESLSYCYPGFVNPALNGVSLDIQPGERIALIGKNGSGKSTLMLSANGILQPQKGGLILNGKKVVYDRAGLIQLRQKVGIVFQNPEDQLFSASVMQDISLGPLNLGLSEPEARKRVMEVAELCELAGLLDRPTHALSSGEKARAALAGILAMEPLYLFADEITNSLDPWMRNQVMRILNQWVDRGNTVILSTHDWELARNWAERIFWLDRGQIYRQGNTKEVFYDYDFLADNLKYGF